MGRTCAVAIATGAALALVVLLVSSNWNLPDTTRIPTQRGAASPSDTVHPLSSSGGREAAEHADGGRRYPAAGRPLRETSWTPEYAEGGGLEDSEYDAYGDRIEAAAPLPAPPGMVTGAVDLAALATAFRAWGRESGPDAIRYALDGLEGDQRLDLAVAAFEGWSEESLREAAGFVASLTGPGSDYLTYAVPQTYFDRDPGGALEWAFNQTQPLYRTNAVKHTMMEWARGGEISEAASWVSVSFKGRDRLQLYEKSAVREVVDHLAKEDFDRARTFVSQFESLEGQQVGIAVLLDHWATDSLDEAGSWLEETVRGYGAAGRDGTFDEAFRVMAFREVERSPERAAAWIGRISDGSLQVSVTRRLSQKLDSLYSD